MLRLCTGFALIVAVLSSPAYADSYPVSGRWTYDYSAAKGPAKQCGARYMDFRGDRRFDTGGGVPDYRNVSVTPSGRRFAIVDELFNGQVRGHVDYVLRRIDPDHIELAFATGRAVPLRRCG